LLKTLTEHPGENADQIRLLLRTEDERRAENKRREEKRGLVRGGLVVVPVGVGLGTMLLILDNRGGAWSVALIPFLIGCALLGAGVLTKGPHK
jgi:hypothetical protein